MLVVDGRVMLGQHASSFVRSSLVSRVSTTPLQESGVFGAHHLLREAVGNSSRGTPP